MIREDYSQLNTKKHNLTSASSLQDAFVISSSVFSGKKMFFEFVPDLKASLMEQILEFYDEIETGVDAAEKLQLDAHHVVLTVYDPTEALDGLKAMKAACAKVKELLVVLPEENANDPFLASLLEMPAVTVIPETAIVALTPRVDSVLLVARSVADDGSFVAAPASFVSALAAKHYSKPVVAVAALYKLGSNLGPHEKNNTTDPTPILAYGDLPSSPDRDPDAIFFEQHTQNLLASALDVKNPDFDHVQANLVDLYITNVGAHQPSYVGRLLSELYSPHDSLRDDDDDEDSDILGEISNEGRNLGDD